MFIHISFIVALNYQTEDEQNIINDGKFCDNGGCGFILKPEYLRDHNKKLEENSDPWKINIKILSGHFLIGKSGSNNNIIPKVKISIKGHPVDEKSAEGLPYYQFEIKIPSLAFIEISVTEDSFGDWGMPFGIFCCPITMLKAKGVKKLILSCLIHTRTL